MKKAVSSVGKIDKAIKKKLGRVKGTSGVQKYLLGTANNLHNQRKAFMKMTMKQEWEDIYLSIYIKIL